MRQSQVLALATLLFVTPAATVSASSITFTVSDSYSEEQMVSLGNLMYLNPVPSVGPSKVMGVGKFDPALGTLLEAELVLMGVLSSRMLNHAAWITTGTASTTASASVRASLLYDPTLNALISDERVRLEALFGTRSLEATSFNPLDGPAVSQERHLVDSFEFRRGYTGMDLAPFLATSSQDELYLSVGYRMLTFSGTHSGWPSNSLLDFSDRPGTAPNVDRSGVNIPFLVAGMTLQTLQLLNIFLGDGHGSLLGYSDFHVASASQIYMEVQYTYEPFENQPVPEPTGLALLGIGVAAVTRRLARRGGRSNA